MVLLQYFNVLATDAASGKNGEWSGLFLTDPIAQTSKRKSKAGGLTWSEFPSRYPAWGARRVCSSMDAGMDLSEDLGLPSPVHSEKQSWICLWQGGWD